MGAYTGKSGPTPVGQFQSPVSQRQTPVTGAIGIKVKGGLVPPYSSPALRRIKLPEQRFPFE
jgi:hypothetical protein